MTESVLHKMLRSYSQRLLEQRGYTVEHEVPIANHRVDVVGIKQDQLIAIECSTSYELAYLTRLAQCGIPVFVITPFGWLQVSIPDFPFDLDSDELLQMKIAGYKPRQRLSVLRTPGGLLWCPYCHHVWKPKTDKPKLCPACKRVLIYEEPMC